MRDAPGGGPGRSRREPCAARLGGGRRSRGRVGLPTDSKSRVVFAASGPRKLVRGEDGSDLTLNALQLCLAESSNECCGTAPTTAPGMCVQTGSGVGGALGGGGCTTNVAETCGGEDFQVVCSCPEGTCVCFDDMDNRVVNFDSCSTCTGGLGPNSADLYTACGFPH